MSASRSDREQTAALLHGAPVGTPEGDVVCDGCNAGVAEYRAVRDEPVTHAEAVYVYVTQRLDGSEWLLRWLNCSECGPVGSGETTESDELHATATLAYDPTMGRFVLDETEPLPEGNQ